MRLALATLIVAVVSSGPALAQDADCKDPQTQLAMNMCADREYKAADAALAKLCEALRKKVSADGRTKLEAAQKAFATYRDAQCTFDTAGTVGGSINGLEWSLCRQKLTEAQTRLLDAQLNCAEGDPSCGGQ